MAFDIKKMAIFAHDAIASFAARHDNETFYGFALDSNLLCLNSVEKFATTIAEYQRAYPEHVLSTAQIADTKGNTGDWTYQGFAEFSAECGFDPDAYDYHYRLGLANPRDDELLGTEYALAMDMVLRELVARNSFNRLKTTEDFYAVRVEHNY